MAIVHRAASCDINVKQMSWPEPFLIQVKFKNNFPSCRAPLPLLVLRLAGLLGTLWEDLKNNRLCFTESSTVVYSEWDCQQSFCRNHAVTLITSYRCAWKHQQWSHLESSNVLGLSTYHTLILATQLRYTHKLITMAEAKPAGINIYVGKQRRGDSDALQSFSAQRSRLQFSVFMVPAAGLERQVEGLLWLYRTHQSSDEQRAPECNKLNIKIHVSI